MCFRKLTTYILTCLILGSFTVELQAYPYDGYAYTGIRRLLRLQWIQDSVLQDKPLLKGAQKKMADIKLHLAARDQTISHLNMPPVDPNFQKMLNGLFPHLHESYSVTLMDISPGKPIRYAKRQADRQFQPGSVGKLAVVTALFRELQRIFPYSFQDRINLLQCKNVSGRGWAVYDEHTVPFFIPETKKFFKRTVTEKDVFFTIRMD